MNGVCSHDAASYIVSVVVGQWKRKRCDSGANVFDGVEAPDDSG